PLAEFRLARGGDGRGAGPVARRAAALSRRDRQGEVDWRWPRPRHGQGRAPLAVGAGAGLRAERAGGAGHIPAAAGVGGGRVTHAERPDMSQTPSLPAITLVLGGARSGKSTWA